MTNKIPAAMAKIVIPITKTPLLGTGAKLIDKIQAPRNNREIKPPLLSTGSFVSFTCAGMYFKDNMSAKIARGKLSKIQNPIM